MCFHFFPNVNLDNIYQKFLQLMLVSSFTSWNSEKKGTYSTKIRLGCVFLKKSFCIMNKIKLVFIRYTETIFLSKNVIFLRVRYTQRHSENIQNYSIF